MGISYSYYTKQATKLQAKDRVLQEFREFVDERIGHYKALTEKYLGDSVNDLSFEELKESAELSGCITEYVRLLQQINKEQHDLLKESRILLKQADVLQEKMMKTKK